MESRGLFLTAPYELALREFGLRAPVPGEARVCVAGCGLCHTDISFYTGAVRTRHVLPLVLGHEIAGVVDAAPPPFEHLNGREVLVPAVIPCDHCELCRLGRDNACIAQTMPGNDVDGGFATHVVVAAKHLIELPPGLGGHSLAELAVVADAVTTPYQAIRRAGVTAGDLAVVIGVGGIGSYAVQIASALGALVAAVDIDHGKLQRITQYGARWTFNARATDARAVKKALADASGVPSARWRIFEMSGTTAGQEFAWGLLGPAAVLGVIGFTMDRPEIRLSNLMAFDATAFGSWGCSPRLYPDALDLVLSGRVKVKPFVEAHPLSRGPELFARASAPGGDGHERRAILVPD